MKKFRDVCLVMVLSAFFPAAQFELPSEAQDQSAVHGPPSAAQGQDAAQAKAAAETPNDPLGRSTPQGTVFGFLQTAQNGKYKEATQYLQLSNNERISSGAELSRKLHGLM